MSRIRRPHPDDGMTLVEVLVAMIVMAVLGIAVVTTTSVSARQSTVAGNRLTAVAHAQQVCDRITKYLRAGHPASANPSAPLTAFSFADAAHVTISSDMQSSGPWLVDLAVSGTSPRASLVESITPPGQPIATVRRITSGDVDVSGGALFTYYDGSGNVLSTPRTTDTDTALIRSVRVTVTLVEPGVAAPVTVSELVYLRNLQYK